MNSFLKLTDQSIKLIYLKIYLLNIYIVTNFRNSVNNVEPWYNILASTKSPCNTRANYAE